MVAQPPVSPYLMEDTREATRLALKVNTSEFYDKYLKPHIGKQAKAILDVGCGPGVIAAQVGRENPKKQVYGVDVSTTRISQATLNTLDTPNVKVFWGNATNLPFSDDTFDLVYCRFLLEYLSDFPKAIAEMYRVCKPGGFVVLQDLDGQIISKYPEPAFKTEMDHAMDFLAKTGFDPFVGRKLYYHAVESGFKVMDVKIESYHLFAGLIDDTNYVLWDLKLDIALPQLAQAFGNKEKAFKFKADYMEYLKDPKTLSFSNVFTVLCQKPLPETV